MKIMKKIGLLFFASLIGSMGLPLVKNAHAKDKAGSENRGERHDNSGNDSRDNDRDDNRDNDRDDSRDNDRDDSRDDTRDDSRTDSRDDDRDDDDDKNSSPPPSYTSSPQINFGNGVSLVNRGEDNEQDSVRNQFRKGNIKKLSDVMAAVKKQVPGDVVSVKLKGKSEAPVYELKILTKNNQLKKIRVDAQSLSIY
jgi:uncharacterized membrane protein YkoI